MKFIDINQKNKLQNLELLLNLERNHPGIFVKVISNFDKAKSFRDCLDEDGRPIKVPWEEALKKFYFENKYDGITQENADIATVFGEKGLSQEIFDKVTDLRKQAKREMVPENILGKAIKEETILQSIDRIKIKTEKELLDGKELLEELYDKQFTYEWLNKNDPRNSILGLFCNCCATITNKTYGKSIAESSIIEPDVQNLVIRNFKGEIIAKGTMYVNKKKGYAVINDFEINEIYRHKEDEHFSGEYDCEETSKEEQERTMIFKAFQRGLKAFIDEYDKQNRNNPLKQVNVGMGYNRLKRQVRQFKKATSNLKVPEQYGFNDASEVQYILYEREEAQMENGGQERES